MSRHRSARSASAKRVMKASRAWLKRLKPERPGCAAAAGPKNWPNRVNSVCSNPVMPFTFGQRRRRLVLFEKLHDLRLHRRVVGFGGENLVDVAHVVLLDDRRVSIPRSVNSGAA